MNPILLPSFLQSVATLRSVQTRSVFKKAVINDLKINLAMVLLLNSCLHYLIDELKLIKYHIKIPGAKLWKGLVQ